MTYEETLSYLDSLTNYERVHQPTAMRAVKLERMRWLCEGLGHPQQRFRSILVGGTNGKGSICVMIYQILCAAGLRVGLYTSPHLADVRERIRVNRVDRSQPAADCAGSDWISQEDFAAIIARLRSAVEAVTAESPDSPPTYFEVLTAAAFVHFAHAGVEVAVLEVGLGGRLDATNVVEPAIAVLGPVGLDHTDVLGQDLVSIAREKAGIMKPNGHGASWPHQAAISARQAPEVFEVLREQAIANRCRFVEYGRHLAATVVAHEPRGLRLGIQSLRGRYEALELPLIGRHQAENAAVAVAAVELLSEDGMPHRAIRMGLAQTTWPGRLELVRERPLVLLDGAHNPQAACALRITLEELWPHQAKHLLIGMSQDKPIRAVGEILGPMAASITCTQSRHPRACDPRRVAEALAPVSRQIHVIADPMDASASLLNTVEPDAMIVITGSLFLVGELRAKLRSTCTHPRR